MKRLYLSGRNADKFALVDDEDYEKVKTLKWFLHNCGYVITNIESRTTYLHRFILSTPSGLETDHINRNKLDNRRSNLRVCTPAENMRNFFDGSLITKKRHGYVLKLKIRGYTYYYGCIKYNLKRYQTVTCQTPEEARGALKQMIKDLNIKVDK